MPTHHYVQVSTEGILISQLNGYLVQRDAEKGKVRPNIAKISIYNKRITDIEFELSKRGVSYLFDMTTERYRLKKVKDDVFEKEARESNASSIMQDEFQKKLSQLEEHIATIQATIKEIERNPYNKEYFMKLSQLDVEMKIYEQLKGEIERLFQSIKIRISQNVYK